MAIHWGFSYGHHDAAGIIIDNGNVVFAERSSKYSGVPFDPDISDAMIDRMASWAMPDKVFIHENKRRDLWRKITSGDWRRLIVRHPQLPLKPVYGNHHLSHAAAAFYTSDFDDALVIVADAIGEQESLAVYVASNGQLDPAPLHVLEYPHSLGLFYSYHVARVGMKPNRDEGKFMELSQRSWINNEPSVLETFHSDGHLFRTTKNLHKYPTDIVTDPDLQARIAATTQHVLEAVLERTYSWFKRYVPSNNLILSGGVAYNTCAVNRLRAHVKNVHVPSHPGDAGSAYGAILQHTHQKIALPFVGNKMFT